MVSEFQGQGVCICTCTSSVLKCPHFKLAVAYVETTTKISTLCIYMYTCVCMTSHYNNMVLHVNVEDHSLVLDWTDCTPTHTREKDTNKNEE